MVTLEKTSLAFPGRFTVFERGRRVVFAVAGAAVSQLALDPGWRWSEHIGAARGMRRCPEPHLTYVVWGHLMVEAEDGTRLELGPGDLAAIPAEHDAWTVGEEACVLYELPAPAPARPTATRRSGCRSGRGWLRPR